MFKYTRQPTTPGEILLEEFLKPLGITQKDLAEHIQCDYKVINRIVNGRAIITPDMATRLADALETTPEFWLNAQMVQDLWNMRLFKRKISSLLQRKQVKRAA
jgi:addiction module HigA family antidote